MLTEEQLMNRAVPIPPDYRTDRGAYQRWRHARIMLGLPTRTRNCAQERTAYMRRYMRGYRAKQKRSKGKGKQ